MEILEQYRDLASGTILEVAEEFTATDPHRQRSNWLRERRNSASCKASVREGISRPLFVGCRGEAKYIAYGRPSCMFHDPQTSSANVYSERCPLSYVRFSLPFCRYDKAVRSKELPAGAGSVGLVPVEWKVPSDLASDSHSAVDCAHQVR